jgi:GntR family transcriptional regulator of gluconate operon
MSTPPTTNGFRRLTRPSVVDLVAEDLRHAILSGRLQPGDRISDARVATEMGISRAPVREAIRQLAARGLVLEQPRRGAFVTRLSRAAVHEVYDCRRALESLAGRRLAVTTDVDDRIRPLRTIVEEMAQISFNDPLARADADHRFHSMLCEVTENTWLIRLYEQIADQSRLIQALDSFAHRRLTTYDLAPVHRPIVDAIATAEPYAAERAILEHIDVAERLFVADLPEIDGLDD